MFCIYWTSPKLSTIFLFCLFFVILGLHNRSLLNPMENMRQSKSGSTSFDVVSSLQNSPPQSKFLATRMDVTHLLLGLCSATLFLPSSYIQHCLTESNLKPPRGVGWKQWKHQKIKAMATGRWSWARLRSTGIRNQAIAQAKTWYCEVPPSNNLTPDLIANSRLLANTKTGSDGPILRRNVNASIGHSG